MTSERGMPGIWIGKINLHFLHCCLVSFETNSRSEGTSPDSRVYPTRSAISRLSVAKFLSVTSIHKIFDQNFRPKRTFFFSLCACSVNRFIRFHSDDRGGGTVLVTEKVSGIARCCEIQKNGSSMERKRARREKERKE